MHIIILLVKVKTEKLFHNKVHPHYTSSVCVPGRRKEGEKSVPTGVQSSAFQHSLAVQPTGSVSVQHLSPSYM